MEHARQGGFTLHDHVGDAPTNGFMVSRDKSTERMLPMEHLTPQHISDFVNKHTAELSHPDNYLGGWLDNGKFYLDISSHVPHLGRATTEAVRAQQLGIYDLGRGQTLGTEEAGWMTGHPGVVGSRHTAQRAQDPAAPAQLAAAWPRGRRTLGQGGGRGGSPRRTDEHRAGACTRPPCCAGRRVPPSYRRTWSTLKPASGSTHEGSEIYRHPATRRTGWSSTPRANPPISWPKVTWPPISWPPCPGWRPRPPSRPTWARARPRRSTCTPGPPTPSTVR